MGPKQTYQFMHTKETVNKMKRHPTDSENIGKWYQ